MPDMQESHRHRGYVDTLVWKTGQGKKLLVLKLKCQLRNILEEYDGFCVVSSVIISVLSQILGHVTIVYQGSCIHVHAREPWPLVYGVFTVRKCTSPLNFQWRKTSQVCVARFLWAKFNESFTKKNVYFRSEHIALAHAT